MRDRFSAPADKTLVTSVAKTTQFISNVARREDVVPLHDLLAG